MDSVRLYLRYVRINIRGQFQYPASLIMLTAGNFLITLIEFMAVWVLFSRFGTLAGWTLPEIGFLYGLIHTEFAVAEAFGRGFDTFSQQVVGGEFDWSMLRPRSTAFQVLAHDFQLLRGGRLLQGLAVLVWAGTSLGLTWNILGVLLMLFTILGGIALFTGLMVVQATTCFWTTQTLEIANSFTYGGVYLSQYPISIYSGWFAKAFIFVVPLACVNYFPALAATGKPDPLGSPDWVRWLSPVAGLLFLAASLGVWSYGVRHYSSTGS